MDSRQGSQAFSPARTRPSSGTSGPEHASKAESFWRTLVERLRERVEAADYETWLRPARALSFEDSRLRVLVPNPTYRDWLAETYTPILREEAAHIGYPDLDVEFTDSPEAKPAPPELPFEPVGVRITSALNPYYTFDTFVVGEGNRLAHAAAKAVTDNPTQSYNPLFLYGGVGLGKTHLLHAVGNQIAAQKSHFSLCYLTAERFTNELIAAIRHQKTDEFRAKYRSIDILLIDDVQFLAGKEQTQEEFFHTFNHLHGAGRQIVLTGDCSPKELSRITERLRSRFTWGLQADIRPPDLETRVAILRKKAHIKKIALPNEVAMMLASRVKSNIRELEGLLNYLIVRASMDGAAISEDFTRDALAERGGSEEAPPVTVRDIQKKVAERFSLTVKKLKEHRNTHTVSTPRHIAMYLARELTPESFPEIGRQFGFDHASVVYACKKIRRRAEHDKEFKKLLDRLHAFFP